MQIANSFDFVTVQKIIKGGLIGAGGSITLALLGYFGALQYSNTTVTVLVSFAIPFLTNVVKEYLAGVSVETFDNLPNYYTGTGLTGEKDSTWSGGK
jgi:hypothetical protein